MLTINPREVSLPVVQHFLQGAIAPRPIAFVSTQDADGNVNLSPFSFFNVFSLNPPILVFSPSRRGRDNTTKHTYDNVLAIPEVVINVVNYAMVQQTSLASTEYPRGVNEFIKSGFTPAKSYKVKPPRVEESPASFECAVKQVIPLGDSGGAGNLVVCEVLLAHFKESILDENNQIDPYKLDAVARMGGDWYCRAQGDMIFKVPKPLQTLGIGFDALPEGIKGSRILTGNDLGMLANVEKLPDNESIRTFRENNLVKAALSEGTSALHELAKEFLTYGEVENAWKVLLADSI